MHGKSHTNDRSVHTWKLRTSEIEFDAAPKIMGIVNVTPDSFSDGGRYSDPADAVEHALRLVEQGADILDIGGESTRPYSTPVQQQEELNRVIPVIEALAKQTSVPISIDTSKAAVAQAAIENGAQIINDVSGLEADPKMIEIAAKSNAGICAMHMRGNPQNMQDDPQYQDVTAEIHLYLQQRRDALLAAGIEQERICLDPGIGFGKTHEHNFQLVRDCDQFLDLGCPILVGHSRKGFIAKAIGDKESDRDAGTLAMSLYMANKGIHILRVHNVQATKHGLDTLRKLACQ